jgi:hypothetical protein
MTSTWAAISKRQLNGRYSMGSTQICQTPSMQFCSGGFSMFYSYRQRRAALRMTLNLALIAALLILLGVPAQF